MGNFVDKFITGPGGGGHHQAAEAVQGGHAHPALRGQVWLHERGGEHAGVINSSHKDAPDDFKLNFQVSCN